MNWVVGACCSDAIRENDGRLWVVVAQLEEMKSISESSVMLLLFRVFLSHWYCNQRACD